HGLNPNAVKAMKEVDVDISTQTSDLIDRDVLNNADLVITLCGDAKDSCPMTPPHVTRWHWGFDDPAKAEGTEEEKWSVFQRVRDEIEERIKEFAEIISKNPRDKMPSDFLFTNIASLSIHFHTKMMAML